jgi:putative tricarboxylic transport membrane protein
MKKRVFFCLVTWICLTMTLALVPEAKAEYPEKVIEVLNSSTPGGGSDLLCRTVVHILKEKGLVKQKMQVVNRPGGAQSVAMNYFAAKKGNPYVIMHFSTMELANIVRKASKLTFEDITPIAMLVTDPQVMFAQFDSPYKDMKSLIAGAKKAPRSVSAALGGVGGSGHFTLLRVQRAAGIEFNVVAFKGGSGAAAALLGGHVDITFGTMSDFIGQIEAKRIRPLAVMGENRLPRFPDLPTMKELGLNIDFVQFRCFLGPRDFPPYAVKFWEEAFAKMIKTPRWENYLNKAQAVGLFLKHEECRRYLVKYRNNLRIDVSEVEALKKKKK